MYFISPSSSAAFLTLRPCLLERMTTSILKPRTLSQPPLRSREVATKRWSFSFLPVEKCCRPRLINGPHHLERKRRPSHSNRMLSDIPTAERNSRFFQIASTVFRIVLPRMVYHPKRLRIDFCPSRRNSMKASVSTPAMSPPHPVGREERLFEGARATSRCATIPMGAKSARI